MSADQNAMNSGQPRQAPPVSPPEQGAVAMLRDLEARVGELKRLHEQAAERDADLLTREQELSLKGEQFASEMAALQEQRAGLARERQDAETLRAQARSEQGEAAAQRERLREQAEELERERGLLAERERALGERERALPEPGRSTPEIEAALDQRELRLTEREESVSSSQKWLGERERAIAERERSAQAAAEEYTARERRLSDQEARLGDQERSLARREEEVARTVAAQAQAERMVVELAQRERELAELAAALEQRSAELREAQARVERDRAAVSEQARTLAAGPASDPSEGSAISAGRAERLQLELGEANAARASLETELSQAREEAARLGAEAREAADATATASAEVRQRDEQIERLGAEARHLRQSTSEALDRSSRAESDARAASSAHLRALADQSERHRVAVSEVEQRLAERERSVLSMSEELERLRAAAARESGRTDEGAPRERGQADADDVEKRDQAILLLKERLERIQSENDTLRADLTRAREMVVATAAPGPAHAAPALPEAAHLRRERLRRYKALLQTQGRKIVAAQTALHKRHADCEQVLGQRARLAGFAGELARREKQVVSARARAGAAASMLYIVATLAVLAVLSWEVAKRVWPGTYIARATIEADARGHKPSAEQVAGWQKDHEALLHDPRLMEFAAERMSRRGLATLASPVELRDRLGRDMYAQSTAPGSITIELRGQGAERTALELDTFVTSLKSLADMARDERGNNLGLTIAQTAAATREPLFDQRLAYAGMVFGGCVAGSMMLGAGFWHRLSRVKKKFDHAQAVEAALDQIDWATLEKSLKRTSAERPGQQAG